MSSEEEIRPTRETGVGFNPNDPIFDSEIDHSEPQVSAFGKSDPHYVWMLDRIRKYETILNEMGSRIDIVVGDVEKFGQRMGITESVVDQMLAQDGKRVQIQDGAILVVLKMDQTPVEVPLEQVFAMTVTMPNGSKLDLTAGSEDELKAWADAVTNAHKGGVNIFAHVETATEKAKAKFDESLGQAATKIAESNTAPSADEVAEHVDRQVRSTRRSPTAQAVEMPAEYPGEE